MKGSDILLVFIAILFPPAAAAIITGLSVDLVINILLTLLGALPGHIHAFWLIYLKVKAEEQYGYGGYIYVGNGTYEPVTQHGPPPPNYGATA